MWYHDCVGKKQKKEKENFDDFYRSFYRERWEELKAALETDARQIAFSSPPLIAPYYLDEASVMAAESLETQPGDRVLDLCAAPGGKSLVIAAGLGPEGSLTVNEKSTDRRLRLIRVLREHLPEEVFRKIRVTAYDAARWGLYEQNAYDRVLLDAPCSSERHVLRSPAHLKQWSPARTKHLAVQAYALLASAFAAVKPGGLIVYSTCALSPLENDEVVRKLLSRKGDAVEIVPPAPDQPDRNLNGERTEFGSIVLPDAAGGKGPLFWARIRKKADEGTAGLQET